MLAQLARGRARRKISDLEQALEGAEFFTDHHAGLLTTMLARIDQADAEIARLSEVIEQLLAPWEEQLQQAGSQPGWGRRSAEDVLAETGPDMSKFRTGGHLVSWAGRAPLDHQSGKRQGRSRHKKGNKYVAAATGETAISAGKTGTREGARYCKLARSRGKAKAWPGSSCWPWTATWPQQSPGRCARVLHAAARLARGGRRRRLKIQATWPWADAITVAWRRAPAGPLTSTKPSQ